MAAVETEQAVGQRSWVVGRCFLKAVKREGDLSPPLGQEDQTPYRDAGAADVAAESPSSQGPGFSDQAG